MTVWTLTDHLDYAELLSRIRLQLNKDSGAVHRHSA